MPGCPRPTSCDCERDHIDAFHHALPQAGGRTCILNMHMLCWTHHRLKTLGLLDVTRIPGTNTQPPARSAAIVAGAAATTTTTGHRDTLGEAQPPSSAGPTVLNGPPGERPPGRTDPPGRNERYDPPGERASGRTDPPERNGAPE